MPSASAAAAIAAVDSDEDAAALDRRRKLATKAVRGQKSKGTPAALRKRSEAFASKITQRGVAKKAVRARARARGARAGAGARGGGRG